MFLTDISSRVPDAPDEVRLLEPLTAGIPVPPGIATHASQLMLVDSEGAPVPLQCDVLDRWPRDDSIRWVLLDYQASVPRTVRLERVDLAPVAAHDDPISLTRGANRYTVATAGKSYSLAAGASEVLSLKDIASGSEQRVLLTIVVADGRSLPFQVQAMTEETVGPLRTTLRIDGVLDSRPDSRLTARVRLSWFAGSPCLRMEVTLSNPRRAEHVGGYWELGDRGSVLFRDASLVLAGLSPHAVSCSEHPGSTPLTMSVPAVLYQDSSGGAHWQSGVHVNRHGKVPVRFRGYELTAPQLERRGDRATPVMWVAEPGCGAITIRHFWQNFPKALEAHGDRLVVRLFPEQFADLHELQGGEQKTHVVGMAFGGDRVAARPLDWISRPALAAAPPEWYERAHAVAYISPVREADSAYEQIVRGAIEGPSSFDHKREAIDEYGWRNFGDIYADHEAVSAPAEAPIVSHYNNQYDAVGGFATQFMRSGDARWWAAMDELARHMVDIDIYQTREDKAAYSGGLFWHTYHYKDAGRATHRCYPRAEGIEGGGPSNEQNYTTGLLNYYFLTGHMWAREAVLGLAEWVIRMDDGRQTVFRWLSRAPTGLASATASTAYHGPGRGAGNSIVTLLNAFRLTGSSAYLDTAEMLIRRCIHPADDIDARHLLDTERRWSYTVFLQTLGRYLDDKAGRNDLDAGFAFARESLLAYARWMADHEYPYLEKTEVLEYPTETWAAQDMRKCEVFLHAARHADSPSERARFRERADFFYRASLHWLGRFETRQCARPVVLMLSYGYMYDTARREDGLGRAPAVPQLHSFGTPEPFVSQRALAVRRAKQIAAAGAVAVVLLFAWFTLLVE